MAVESNSNRGCREMEASKAVSIHRGAPDRLNWCTESRHHWTAAAIPDAAGGGVAREQRPSHCVRAAKRKVDLIDLEPGTFRAWCRVHGHDRDGQARKTFVAMLARAQQAAVSR